MASNSLAVQRLMREKAKMDADPNPHFMAIPTPANVFEWHFVLFNFSEDSPFRGGQFHGIIQIPVEYPLKPPSILFQTPSGRFKIGEKICLYELHQQKRSFTNYHPESWSTSWTISSMLIGLISFMHTDEGTVGGVDSHITQKKIFAQKSVQYNLQNPRFVELFGAHFERLGIAGILAPTIDVVIEDNQAVLLPRVENNQRRKKIIGGFIVLGTAVAVILVILLI